MTASATTAAFAINFQLISRDKSLTNRQKEVVELSVENTKLREKLADQPKKEEPVSSETSPGRQRPIQVLLTADCDWLVHPINHIIV